MVSQLLNSIELPKGLRTLSIEQLQEIAKELRHELIDNISTSGGHFASSLGATELTVALHSQFNTPSDLLVWDVGHQAYIHKMLTGRRDQMSTIRKKGGISGFLKRSESQFDTFGAGHAGTSISAAVGMSAANQGENNSKYTVAIIGDGSLTAGMAFEALNHAGALKLKKFIVVLNDNEMSISENVGALSWLFSKAVTSKVYTQARAGFKHLHQTGVVPELIYKVLDRAEEAAQSFVSHTSLLFEAFGFRYIGVVDGHDIGALVTAFTHAKDQDGPVLIHIRTAKGKGYEPAEEDPITWHGVSPFDKTKAKFIPITASVKKVPTYTQIFAETLIRLSSENQNIVAITAAMPGGTGLDLFQKEHPDKFFDVGICEQHAVTFAAGLATQGKLAVCAIYSTFLQRAFDQVLHDVCIQNLPVIFAIDRAGVVGNDGETHQGAFDIAYLRTIPNISLMSPKDENELGYMMYTATLMKSPVAIRYPRGNGAGVEIDTEYKELEVGKAEVVQQGSDILFISYGPVLSIALQVADQLNKEFGVTSTIINARWAKPLDQNLLIKELPLYKVVCTIEDHALLGGFSSAITELVNDHSIHLESGVHRFGVQDEFVSHGTQTEQQNANGFGAEQIYSAISSELILRKLVNKKLVNC